MKIRSKLLLFLIPAIIFSNFLIAALFSYKWHSDLKTNFHAKVESALIFSASQIAALELEIQNTYYFPKNHSIYHDLKNIKDAPVIKNVYLIPNKHSKNIPFYPSQKVYISEKDRFKERITGYMGLGPYLLAIDVSSESFSKTFQENLLIIISTTLGAIFLTILLLFIISHKISKPVQNLSNAALTIAAGQYGEKIQVKGPKEIVDFSNTLNTMSECLQENINRAKENSIRREKKYGEYEFALMLQHLMLDVPIQECTSDALAIQAINIYSHTPTGLRIDFQVTDHLIKIHLIEATKNGFKGMYDLLTSHKKEFFPFLYASFDPQTLSLSFHPNSFTPPLVWSLSKKSILTLDEPLQKGDCFFLYSPSLLKLYSSVKQLQLLIHKVFNNFSEEGLNTAASMLKKEIGFMVRKKDFEEDLHLISFQVL